MKPRSFAAGAPPGHYTHSERPLRAVLERMNVATVRGLLQALRAGLAGRDRLWEGCELNQGFPPGLNELWDKSKAAFLRAPSACLRPPSFSRFRCSREAA